MSNVRQFGRRVPARPSYTVIGGGAVRRQIRIPVPAIVVLLGLIFAGVYLSIPVSPQVAPVAYQQQGVTVSGHFPYCVKGQGFNCIIDGDTFRYQGESIRIADINTPETYRADCAAEKALGDRATRRMQALLNAGSFQIAPYERDTDKYGRKLRIIMRDGRSLGLILVSEGLAEKWKGYRSSWCG